MASRSRSRSPIRGKSEEKCNDSELQETKSIECNDSELQETKSIESFCENDADDDKEEDTNIDKKDEGTCRIKKKMVYKLLIHNIPTTWKYDGVKKFIYSAVTFKKEVCLGYIGLKKFIKNNTPIMSCSVPFPDKESRLEAYEQLNGMLVEDKHLYVEMMPDKGAPNSKSKNDIDEDQGTSNSSGIKKPFELTNWKPEATKFKIINRSLDNPNETYGLGLQFLSSLGITTPLVPRIKVTNLAPNIIDSNIKEVFGMAGQIIDAAVVFKNGTKFAVVNYDHPVEAVQAISMFNNVELLNYKLRVVMDRKNFTYKLHLPRGLSRVGPGLGAGGGILRYARAHADLLALTRRVDDLCEAIKSAPAQPQGAWSAGNPSGGAHPGGVTPLDTNSQIVNLLQTLVQQQTANMAAPMQNMHMAPHMGPQSVPQPIPQPVIGPNTMVQYPIQNQGIGAPPQVQAPYPDAGPSNFSHNTPDKNATRYEKDTRRQDSKPSDLILIKYLPPYVTLDALKQKMSEVGKLVFAEMTGHGKALLRFTSQRDGDECIKLFDRSKVDGQMIEVQYF